MIRSGTKGEEQHQGKLKNMRRSTKKPKTTREKTIGNTTRKEGGFDSPEVAHELQSSTRDHKVHVNICNNKTPNVTLIFTKPRVRMELHKTWERSMMFKACIQEQGNQERGAKRDLLA